MEVLEFALQTIRRVDSGGSVGDDEPTPGVCTGSGGNEMLIRRMVTLNDAYGIGPGAVGLTESEECLVELAGLTWQCAKSSVRPRSGVVPGGSANQ